ncbi:MAG: TraB/GumN family protein [Candidatus Pseudobacter hemicellulosilyticus]|uniref:TraB/GumN family protein n=1 Tax=Candidatus Pseudobacter hemicellulosilyticus TaxID=3121375 RepID=A0AAJ5WUF0_9BACT|nr:MAG: TraB/GumN family protein [Pseudobacter sp.]
MKKSGLALLLVISSLAQAQQKTAKAPVASNNTLLWKISGKGLVKPSYLFGTMHILCSDDARLSPNLNEVIKEVNRIYFELDMDNPQEMWGAMNHVKMNDNKKLSDLLTAEEYSRVEKFFQENKMPPLSMLNTLKPMFASVLISERLMTCEKKNGMEEQIMAASKNLGKEIFGLETPAYQMGLFDSIPYEEQARSLLGYIDNIDSYREATQEMVDVYRKQDLKRLDSLVVKSDPGMDKYMDLLLYNRNRNWVDFFPAIVEGGRNSLLIAVGAGHLPGDKGVISLLRKAGYTVKPMIN